MVGQDLRIAWLLLQCQNLSEFFVSLKMPFDSGQENSFWLLVNVLDNWEFTTQIFEFWSKIRFPGHSFSKGIKFEQCQNFLWSLKLANKPDEMGQENFSAILVSEYFSVIFVEVTVDETNWSEQFC